MKRAATILVALIIVAQIALIGYARANTEEDTRPIPPIPPSTEPLFPLAFEGIVHFADEQARTWRPDALLVQSNLQVDWPREPEEDPAPIGQIPRGGWISLECNHRRLDVGQPRQALPRSGGEVLQPDPSRI